jgi:hypothetical protein
MEDNHVGLADIAIVKCQSSVLGFRQLFHLAVTLAEVLVSVCIRASQS